MKIESKDLLSFNYYTYGEPFSGSFKGMRYRLQKKSDGQDAVLETVIWPEPFSEEKTDDGLKIKKTFDFTEDGKEDAVCWLNEMYESKNWEKGM